MHFYTMYAFTVRQRSQSVLELLGLDGDAYLEMPNLGEVDAMRLFLHHVASGQQFFKDEEKHDILTCVRRCYFSKGDGQGHHYHPLALQSLGLQLGCHGENPSLWVKHLPRARTFNYLSGENPVFDIMRSSFDLLPPRDQALFMDVGCFSYRDPRYRGAHFECLNVGWLCAVQKLDEEEITYRLEHLKRKGLLQDVDLRTRKVTMHDLYLEFTKLEAKGSFNDSTNLMERKWVYIENGDLIELKCKPKGGCWYKLIRLTIKHLPSYPNKYGGIVGQIGSLEGIKWDYFSNLEVLQLLGVLWGQRALTLEGLVCLRILEVVDVSHIDEIEVLEELKNLTHFTGYPHYSSYNVGVHIVGRLPLSLIRLKILGDGVVLGLDLLAQCHNLCKLELAGVEVHSLDLSNCWSMENVTLSGIRKLQRLEFTTHQSSNLQSLKIWKCMKLVDILGIDHLTSLKEFEIGHCPKFEVPNMLPLTKLEVLLLRGQSRLLMSSKDSIPHQLRELHWQLMRSSEELNLSGCNQLEILSLSGSTGLTSLAELGDLPALRRLDLAYCKHLLRLPDLSMSRNLQELDLNGCSALELHEKDFQMLSGLRLL